MPGKRSTVRQIREILRLHHEAHLGERQIAAVCLVGKGTVQRFLQRAAAVGLGWPLPEGLDDTELEKLLFPPVPTPAGTRPQPDFTKVHQELKSNRSVTLQLLWEEYKESQPDGVNGPDGGPTLDMARKQGPGPAAEDLPARNRALRGGHQLPLRTPTGWSEATVAVEL